LWLLVPQPGSCPGLPLLLCSAAGADVGAPSVRAYMGRSPPAPREALGAGEEAPERLPRPLPPRQPPPPTARRLARGPGDVTGDCGFVPNKRDADRPPGLGQEVFFRFPLRSSNFLEGEVEGSGCKGVDRGGKGGTGVREVRACKAFPPSSLLFFIGGVEVLENIASPLRKVCAHRRVFCAEGKPVRSPYLAAVGMQTLQPQGGAGSSSRLKCAHL
jgi:hypothetical protein